MGKQLDLFEKEVKDKILQDNINDVINADKNKKPIYKGCPNSGSPCFCTGECREVVGYIDVGDLNDFIKSNIKRVK